MFVFDVKPLALIVCLFLTAAAPLSAKSKAPTVDLDVKDAEARVVLKSLQTQCGIKNLVVDPDVTGSGTFYFRDVPCETAFRVVLRTMNLTGQIESNSIMAVERR